MASQKDVAQKNTEIAKALRFKLVREPESISIEERSAQAVQRILAAMRAARKKAEKQTRIEV